MKRKLYLLIFLVVIGFAIMEIVNIWQTTRRAARCADFPSRQDAQNALQGNPQLDRDKDGMACEDLVR